MRIRDFRISGQGEARHRQQLVDDATVPVPELSVGKMRRDLLRKAQTDSSVWICCSGDVKCTVRVTRAMAVNDDS